MRFIDVTRYGGVKTLRLSVAAIAYVDACEGGAVIRLIGGESLRVNEDPVTVEARAIDEGFITVEEACAQVAAPLTAGVDVTAEGVTIAVQRPRKAPARKGKRK